MMGCGIIPARAGFTRGAHIRGDDTEDHPRSRGVYGPVQVRAGWRPRIIPARAGFTPGRRRSPGRGSDHPRSRGVYAVLPAGVQTGNGSSPLARGLQNEPSADTQPRRIIPARAGFTWPDLAVRRSERDHPRSRGVYPGPPCQNTSPNGSSPLARGLQGGHADAAHHPGIIPARAGFTVRAARDAARARDHPRSRGVYPVCRCRRVMVTGSSPLARGLRHGQR